MFDDIASLEGRIEDLEDSLNRIRVICNEGMLSPETVDILEIVNGVID